MQIDAASMLATNASARPDPYALVMWITATLSIPSAVITSATTEPWKASLGTTRKNPGYAVASDNAGLVLA